MVELGGNANQSSKRENQLPQIENTTTKKTPGVDETPGVVGGRETLGRKNPNASYHVPLLKVPNRFGGGREARRINPAPLGVSAVGGVRRSCWVF